MAFVLTALTLNQLFARQAQLHADHERILAARNGCAIFSFDWDLQNAALTGTMQDIAEVTVEISSRIVNMVEETNRNHDRITDVPMVCTHCRRPVCEWSFGEWRHAIMKDAVYCTLADGEPIKAMVAEGNESIPRS